MTARPQILDRVEPLALIAVGGFVGAVFLGAALAGLL
jgi:hypothetical protein